MLLKLLQDGFGSAMDLNCAEKILYGANWAYNMKLPGEALKLAAGFGGGMGVESSCGVITGGVMVLSSLYVSRNSLFCPSGSFVCCPRRTCSAWMT